MTERIWLSETNDTPSKDHLATPQKSVLVEVSDDRGDDFTFLIAPRQDGWYVHSEDPFGLDLFRADPTERWSYSWNGPHPTREEAIKALPEVMREYVEIIREVADALEEFLDNDVDDFTSEMESEISMLANGRRPPRLRVVSSKG